MKKLNVITSTMILLNGAALAQPAVFRLRDKGADSKSRCEIVTEITLDVDSEGGSAELKDRALRCDHEAPPSRRIYYSLWSEEDDICGTLVYHDPDNRIKITDNRGQKCGETALPLIVVEESDPQGKVLPRKESY